MRSNHSSTRIRTLRRRRLALALVTAMAAPMAMAQSLPSGGNVTWGDAMIGGSGTEMTITQTSRGAIINWYGFNIGAGYGVTFDQQFGASSVTLNRVLDSTSASLINGTLSANGTVFIINSAGIVFGSGAQVNVGGLVASALDIEDQNFQDGVISGNYDFTSFGTTAGAIWNDGQLTAADGGTIALIGSQINNAGTISATNGSVAFGATSDVTLDFFGDGLTQVTVSGNGLGVSNCTYNCNGGITSSGNVFAQGGHIEMRSNTMDGAPAGNGLFVDPANGGRIWISGNVSARTSGSRRGSVIIDAGMGNIDLGGVAGQVGNVSANASNPGEQAGTIEISGNQLFTHLCVWTNGLCENNNQLGLINASTYGDGGLAGGTITIDVGRFYHAGVVQASSATGAGGTVNINADSAEIYNLVFAEGYGGPGGTINLNANNLLLHRGQTPWLGGPGTLYSLATLSAFGATSGGTVNLDAGSLSMVDLGNVSPDTVNLDPAYRPTINVNGYDGNGGTINVDTSAFALSPWQYFEATGTQVGGNIAITADSINLAGGLVATGATGGTVTTTTTGSLFAAATAYIKAGTWLVHAPSVQIMPTSGAVSGTGAVLTDDALSSTLDGGTLIQLYADASMVSGATGNIYIGDGVNIVHATGDAAALELRATAGIYGSDFSIQSTGGPLDLSFTANVHGSNQAEGYVSFSNAALTSNGGDIAMTGDGQGVYLEYSQLSSGAGDISVTGTATGSGSTGVSVNDSAFASTSGSITITGSAALGEGVSFNGSSNGINTTSGAIVVTSTGLSGLHVADVPFSTDSGDITLEGTALGDDVGVYIGAGGMNTNGGDITIIGHSTSQAGVWVYGGGIASHGGDITISGHSDSDRGVFMSHGSSIASAGGDIRIAGLGGDGAGFAIDADSSIDAGSGLVELSAGNDGGSDAIVLQGNIASTKAVNLRPINEADAILIGADNGFSLSNAELAMINSPLLVIGSAEHAGAIRVLQAIDRDGNLTLQNQGGNGGIDIQAALDVGDYTLALASGGNISQTAAGAITAHSLLASAGGNVALTAAENNLAASSLAGSAGGGFAYQDMDDLAIGTVSSFGYSAIDQTGLVSLSATGIVAQGNVLVRTASGDLILDADVSGSNIDLVAANVFRNPAGAALNASNDWRIWARTWEGEERGGLQGDGLFDIYGCAFGQDCLGIDGGNRFIYQEHRFVQAPIAPETVAEWLDEDDLDGTATDLLVAELCPVADSSADLLQQVTSKDELAQEWQKSRRRLQLSNCIDSKSVPGCRF